MSAEDQKLREIFGLGESSGKSPSGEALQPPGAASEGSSGAVARSAGGPELGHQTPGNLPAGGPAQGVPAQGVPAQGVPGQGAGAPQAASHAGGTSNAHSAGEGSLGATHASPQGAGSRAADAGGAS